MSDTNYMEIIQKMDNAELLAFAQMASEDLAEAADNDHDGEWHGCCFAACVVAAQEMSKRGIKLPGAPSVH